MSTEAPEREDQGENSLPLDDSVEERTVTSPDGGDNVIEPGGRNENVPDADTTSPSVRKIQRKAGKAARQNTENETGDNGDGTEANGTPRNRQNNGRKFVDTDAAENVQDDIVNAVNVSRFGNIFLRVLGEQLRPHGVSAARGLALLALSDAGRPVPSTVLVQRVGIARSGMTALSDKLTNDGYITREKHEGDRRVQLLTLTDKGRATVDAIRPIVAEFSALVPNSLKDAEAAILDKAGMTAEEAIS